MMVALREKVSSGSTIRSLLIAISQGGIDMAPGPLPVANVTVHVVSMKSSPAIV